MKTSNAFKHGMRKTRIYRTWSHMKGRCNNPNDKAYKYYGGRGIKVCDRWNDFVNFQEDMGADYDDSLSIERINVNGDYKKFNCRWIKFSEQSKNRRTNRKITYKGVTKNINDWAKDLGIKRTTLRMRLDRYGYSIDKTFNEKVSYNHG